MAGLEDSIDLVKMRAWSHNVFGSPHRLPVGLAAARAAPNEFYAAQIAEQAGIDRRQAGRLLDDLSGAGMLRQVSGPDHSARYQGRGQPPTYFERAPDDFWECIVALGERYRRSPPSGPSGS